MKLRKYQARELDPRSSVVPIKDVDKAIDKIRNEAIKSYESIYDLGFISVEMKNMLIDRINDLQINNE